jgi:hypothetical protein
VVYAERPNRYMGTRSHAIERPEPVDNPAFSTISHRRSGGYRPLCHGRVRPCAGQLIRGRPLQVVRRLRLALRARVFAPKLCDELLQQPEIGLTTSVDGRVRPNCKSRFRLLVWRLQCGTYSVTDRYISTSSVNILHKLNERQGHERTVASAVVLRNVPLIREEIHEVAILSSQARKPIARPQLAGTSNIRVVVELMAAFSHSECAGYCKVKKNRKMDESSGVRDSVPYRKPCANEGGAGTFQHSPGVLPQDLTSVLSPAASTSSTFLPPSRKRVVQTTLCVTGTQAMIWASRFTPDEKTR